MGIIREKKQAIPFLLEILSNTRDNLEKYADPSYFGHIYATYLLAQFRVKDAYPPLIDLMSIPDDLTYTLFGDFVLEAGSRMLASVCEGDTSLIKLLVENKNADEYMRTQAIEALAILAIKGLVENDEVVDYFQKLVQEESVRSHPMLLAFLVTSYSDMYAEELFEDLKKCYEEGLVDETVVNMKDLEDTIKLGRDQVLLKSRNDAHLQLINDTIAEMKHWPCFMENERNTKNVRQDLNNMQTVNKVEKVGRNNPCPCGSGKKYKKCCGK